MFPHGMVPLFVDPYDGKLVLGYDEHCSDEAYEGFKLFVKLMSSR